MNHRRLSLALMLILTQLPARVLAEGAGSRPMNVAVSAGADAVLATSMGSTCLTQANGFPGGNYSLVCVGVYEPSWGVVFLDHYTVVVTHPNSTHLSVLTRPTISATFEYDHAINLGEQFRYSTEIIAKPGSTTRVLVANRGRAPIGSTPEESWCNAAYEVDIVTQQIEKTFITEREPRALAVSPNGQRLFVGHAQGSLGGAHLAGNDPHPNNAGQNGFSGDGGSILMYDLADAISPVHPMEDKRIGVGSPVRGLAVTGNTDGSYVVYFTSVGDNANSEDPEEGAGNDFFGGRHIPNVISAAYYSSGNDSLLSLVHALFRHNPEWTPDGPEITGQDLPAVLPEKLAVRDYTSGGQRKRELWVTNSGSGTVSRALLAADGSLVTEGTKSLTLARLTRDASHHITISTENQTFPLLKKITSQSGANVSHVDLTRSQPRFTSDVRGIAYSPVGDRIWVVTRFDNELLQISGGASATTIRARWPIAAPVAGTEERNFFGFGRGFLFRELSAAGRVGNQTCSTCHVDGHSDGKVRITKRRIENQPRFTSERKPVAVPTCFDVGSTEWIFFEGTRTIRDGNHGESVECSYCGVAGFFDDTEAFTDTLSSPASAYHAGGPLTASERRGRYLFESMNCSRCHAGPIPSFDRTNQALLPAGVPNNGPIPAQLTLANRLLHDPSQVFLSDGVIDPNDRMSHRNMTDVGTRVNNEDFDPDNESDPDGIRNGINTPPLAGLWDARPYLHDGRYRTIEEVLTHTYADTVLHRAAQLVAEGNPGTTPDNAFDALPMGGAPVPPTPGAGLFEFGTHAPTAPSGVESLDEYLGAGSQNYQDLVAFLMALSSRTNPCGGIQDFIQDLSVSVIPPDTLVATWDTEFPTECEAVWTGEGVNVTERTAFGTEHSSTIAVSNPGSYAVDVTALMRTVCGIRYQSSASTNVSGPLLQSQGEDRRLVTGLGPAHPNPFNPQVTIEFSLAETANVSLVIYDASGRRVRTLVDELRARNHYSVQWNGRDDRGNPVASGVYFCRMVSGEYVSGQKLVMLK